jgi:hypothetical protein
VADAAVGGAADRAWELVSNTGADLYFPDLFEGKWEVYSTLIDIQTPFGEELLGGYRGVRDRATNELNATVRARRKYVPITNSAPAVSGKGGSRSPVLTF